MIERHRKSGFMDRRSFAAGASALASGGLWLPRSARAQQPKKGGTFRIGLGHGSTTDNLDPGSWENDFTIQLAHATHNYLAEVDSTGALIPELAESWEASDGATRWRFVLKPGLTFHDGRSVTAADVAASIDHHRGEDSTSAIKGIMDPIDEVIVEDERSVVVVLNGGNADFPFIASDYHLPILPSTDGKIDPTSSIGCGPYELIDWEPGVRARLRKFADYHKSDRAHFDAVEILSIVDPTARTNALFTDQIDCMDQVDLKTVHLLTRNAKVRVIDVTGNQHYTFPMRADTDPFTDNEIRLALKYGVDREALVSTILKGYGALGNDHPIGPSQRYFNSELEQRAYDPDRAKHHLERAGLSRLSVALSSSEAAFPGAIDAAQLYSERASRAGIDIQVVREPDDGYWSNVWMVKPWTASYWGGRPTEDWMFSTTFASGANWNEGFWDHDRFNELLVAARSELDEDKRRQMYWEMQEIVSNEGSVVIPMFANYVFAVADKVKTPETISALWAQDGHRGVERWWFDE